MIEKQVASDFQIYQLLSAIKNETHPFYLPDDLVKTIAIKAHNITTLRCYKKYGACLESIDSLLYFIGTQAEADTASTVHILKTCLAYSGKSLGSIKNTVHETVFHIVTNEPFFEHLSAKADLNYYIDVLCQVAGEDLVDVLCVQDCGRLTALQHTIYYTRPELVKKFIALAGNRKLELLYVKNNGTALDLAKTRKEYFLEWISMPEYAACVFKYWAQIDDLNIVIELLEPYYAKQT